MKWGVLQYCVVRPTCVIVGPMSRFFSFDASDHVRTTLAAIILNHIGLYCEQSWSPRWGHIYVRDAHFWIFLVSSDLVLADLGHHLNQCHDSHVLPFSVVFMRVNGIGPSSPWFETVLRQSRWWVWLI